MRIFDIGFSDIYAVAISRSGRYLAASGVKSAVFDWASGESVLPLEKLHHCPQFAFYNDDWLIHPQYGELCIVALNGEPARQSNFPAVTSVAVSPDGKTLVAPSRGTPNNAKLHRWSLPNLQVISGFDYWSPFRKLAFSPDGEFLASIWDHSFELRFAVTGGLDYRYVPRRHAIASVIAPGFVAFSPDSELCVFGWEEEFRVLDISTGTSRVVKRVDADFTDAAFTGSGQFFVTTHLNGTVKFWNPQTWEVVREYDWGCGMLTAIAFTADGSAGVCGTKQGQLVQFDIDD